METGRIGEIGVGVIVNTVQEQEHGTEPDLVPTHHLLAMERKGKTWYILFNNPDLESTKYSLIWTCNNQLKYVPLYYQFNILPGTVLVNYSIMELVMINAVSLKQIVLHRGIKNKSEI